MAGNRWGNLSRSQRQVIQDTFFCLCSPNYATSFPNAIRNIIPFSTAQFELHNNIGSENLVRYSVSVCHLRRRRRLLNVTAGDA